jgi:hypothetical protein
LQMRKKKVKKVLLQKAQLKKLLQNNHCALIIYKAFR